jgi:mRNA interferase MazF
VAVEAGEVRRGCVVLVRLPKDKARPAVVVRADLLDGLAYAPVLLITSDLQPQSELRIDVAPTDGNGLRLPSQVMTDWPQTIRLADMGQVIGRLDTETMRAITRQMAVVLGIGAGTGKPRSIRRA